MHTDPIVEDVRAIRAQRQVQFSGNADLAYADLLRQRAELARQGLVFINPATQQINVLQVEAQSARIERAGQMKKMQPNRALTLISHTHAATLYVAN